jgi:hypothetical protein
MSSDSDVMVLRQRFASTRELLNHLFVNKGVELALVKQLTHSDNVEMLTEIVSFILDRPNYPNHIPALEAGSRCAELAVINYLGINHGYKYLDEQHNILFYVFSLSKPAKMIDFFRILRSRTDWTSTEFKNAIKNSPLHAYEEYVRTKLVQVTPARRHFFSLAYVTALAFNGTGDNINRWLHTETSDADILVINPTITPTTHYQTIEHIMNEIFRNGIGGINLELYQALLGKDSTGIKTVPADNYKFLQNVEEECDILPIAVRSAFIRFETFALSYLSIYSNDYEIIKLKKGLKSAETSAEDKVRIQAELDAYEITRKDYRALFDYLVDLYGVSLCSITEVIAVYLCAKVYGDDAVCKKMTEIAGIDDNNMFTYDNTIRMRFTGNKTSMVNGLPELTKTPTNLTSNLLVFFIRRNLIKAAQHIMTLNPNKALQELVGDNNVIALTASTAVAHPSTVKWLIKQKAKLCSNSKSGSKYNVFVCALFSLGSPESRLEMMVEAFEFTQRNPAFKPDMSVDEFFEAVRMAWTSVIWSEPGCDMRLGMLEFALTNLVNKTAWGKLKETPDKYLKLILNSIPSESFLLSDFTTLTQERLDVFHSEMLKLFQLVLPKAIAPHVVTNDVFKRLFQHAFSSKNIELVEYLLEFDPKVELNEFIGLTQSTSSSFDFRDLIILPSPLFNVHYNGNTPTDVSETLQATRQFAVTPFKLKSCDELFGDLLDVDYCEHKLLLGLDPQQPMPDDVKAKVRGAAEKSGVKQIEWDAFETPEGEEGVDHCFIGGEGCDQDGVYDVNVDTTTNEDYLQTDEFQAGITFLQKVFEANNKLSRETRSPFLKIFELLYNRCGNSEGIDMNTSDSAQEFGRYWLDISNTSIPIVTSHHLMWSIIRQLFPSRPVDIPIISQLLAATSTTAFLNKRVWVDDFVFDYFIEMIGATDHNQISAVYEQFQQYTQNDEEVQQYLNDRAGVTYRSEGSTTLTSKTDLVWNFQQYVWTKSPFTLNNTVKNLLLSFVFSMSVGYISIVGSEKHRAQERYMQQYEMAQKRRQEPPPLPFSFVPPNYFLDSLRTFAFAFHQLKWVPQLYLKLAIAQFEIQNVTIYGDLYDLFITHGGELLNRSISCRLPPASYPIMIPAEKADRFAGYYEYVLGMHGIDIQELQTWMEEQMKATQGVIEAHESAQAQSRRLEPNKEQTHSKKNNKSYVLPVILGVGAALAGLAGFFYWSSQQDDDDDIVHVSKQRKK